jgi:hypothetical protein
MSNNRDGFEIDLTGYVDRSSALLDPGTYLVRIVKAEAGETKKGDPKVTLFYTVVGGAFDGSPLVDTLTLTEAAMFRVVKVLRAVGLKVEKKKLIIPFKALVGRTLAVTVDTGDAYNGVKKSEVRDYGPSSTAPNAPAVEPKVEEPLVEAVAEVPPVEEQVDSIEEIGSEELTVSENGEVSVPTDITL